MLTLFIGCLMFLSFNLGIEMEYKNNTKKTYNIVYNSILVVLFFKCYYDEKLSWFKIYTNVS